MKKTLIVLTVFIGWTMSSQPVKGQMELTGFTSSKSSSQEPLETLEAKSDIIHGYHPKYFSAEARTFSTTANQQGHYIAGFLGSDLRPLPSLSDVTLPEGQRRPVSAGVLMAQPRQATNQDDSRPKPGGAVNDRPTVYNDTKDLDNRIQQHRWTNPDEKP